MLYQYLNLKFDGDLAVHDKATHHKEAVEAGHWRSHEGGHGGRACAPHPTSSFFICVLPLSQNPGYASEAGIHFFKELQ